MKFYLIYQLQNVDIFAKAACQRLFNAFFISLRLVANGICFQFHRSSQQRFFIAKPYTDIFANGVRKENGKQCGQHF